MPEPSTDQLKAEVKAFWNRESCETNQTSEEKFSREYFEEVEHYRYSSQPFIHSFAQFTRYHDKRVLEVGFGAGTDFVQWLRAGAVTSGIDLTEEALANLTKRIEIYGLPKPECIQTGDAENLPFEANVFDLGYSYGVLHHTPNTEKAIGELIRVVRPGGEIKIMLYNRHSLNTLNLWVRFALLKGRPWKSYRWVLWNHQESICTKAYTKAEVRKLLTSLKMTDIRIKPVMMDADFGMEYFSFSRIVRPLARFLIRLTEPWWGWSLLISARKL